MMYGFIVGAGQGGCRLAREISNRFGTEAAYLNLAGIDFSKFNAPRNRMLVIESGGTGKDPVYGEKQVRSNMSRVREFFKYTPMKSADDVLLVIGGGGGSGSGFLFPLLDTYARFKRITVLYTLPLRSEGVPAKPNSLRGLNRLVEYTGQNVTILPVDNEHCMNLQADKRGRDEENSYWGTVNRYIANTLQWHWQLTTLENHKNYYDLSLGYEALDSNDLKRILFGGDGLVDFREAVIEAPNDMEGIERQIKSSGLLFEGLNLKSANRYAVTISIPYAWREFEKGLGVFMDAVFDAVGRVSSKTPNVVRSSFYNKKFQKVRVRVIASGLDTNGPGIRKIVKSMRRDMTKIENQKSASTINLGI